MLLRILLVLLAYCFTSSTANKAQQKILSIEANCTRDLMHVKINMGRPFKGMVFAKGFSEECGSVAGNWMRDYDKNVGAKVVKYLRRFSIVDTSTFILWNSIEVRV
jgi:hypothetical protein